MDSGGEICFNKNDQIVVVGSAIGAFGKVALLFFFRSVIPM